MTGSQRGRRCFLIGRPGIGQRLPALIGPPLVVGGDDHHAEAVAGPFHVNTRLVVDVQVDPERSRILARRKVGGTSPKPSVVDRLVHHPRDPDTVGPQPKLH